MKFSRFLAGLLLLSLAAAAHALRAGDLMFTAYNADEDGWAMVALVDLQPDTVVFFSDNAFDGTRFGSGEGFLRWSSGDRVVDTGTVLRFQQIDSLSALRVSAAAGATVGSLERVFVAGSTAPNLSQTAETLYAYQGPAAQSPQVFISAVSTAGFIAAEGALAGTGLVLGNTAIELPAGADLAQYEATRHLLGPSRAQARAQLAQAAGNWASQNVGQFAAQAVSVEVFTPVPDAPAALLGLVGLACLAAGAARGARTQNLSFAQGASK